MPPPERLKRFQLIKRVLENEKNNLSSQLAHLQAQITKKEASIKLFSGYRNEYQEKIRMMTAQHIVVFRNLQLFLDQISKVLHKEKDEITFLQAKSEELKLLLYKKIHQIETLDKTMATLTS